MTILEKMQLNDNFSATENSIIDFMLNNQELLSDITIQKLASATYSSNATIVRLCKKMGYKGLREFRVALVKELESSKYVTSEVNYTYPFHRGESTSIIVNNLYSLYKKSMDQVLSQLDYTTLDKISRCIVNSNRIFLFGIGDVRLTLHGFINKMVKINYFPVLATDNGEDPYICENITQGDCTLFVTYSAKHIKFAEYACALSKKKVPVLVLTANPDCELVRHSTSTLIVPDLEKENKISTFYSELAFEYLLNLIFALIYSYSKK